jgi:hypothetical protein
LDNLEEFRFLDEDAVKFNRLEEGEFVACQTYPPPKVAWVDGRLCVLNLVYRGFDYAQAKQAVGLENMGCDYSSVGVCQVVNGRLFKLNYEGKPDEELENPSYYQGSDYGDY